MHSLKWNSHPFPRSPSPFHEIPPPFHELPCKGLANLELGESAETNSWPPMIKFGNSDIIFRIRIREGGGTSNACGLHTKWTAPNRGQDFTSMRKLGNKKKILTTLIMKFNVTTLLQLIYFKMLLPPFLKNTRVSFVLYKGNMGLNIQKTEGV